jgi:hypothetical protein
MPDALNKEEAILEATAEFIAWDKKNNCPIVLIFESTQAHNDYKPKVLEHLKHKIALRFPPTKKRFYRAALELEQPEREKLEAAEKVLSHMILPSLPIEFPENKTANITIGQKTFKLDDDGCNDIALITAILIISPTK